jgi:hypothetical protein
MTAIRALLPVETWQGLAKLRDALTGSCRQGGVGAHIPSAPSLPTVAPPLSLGAKDLHLQTKQAARTVPAHAREATS